MTISSPQIAENILIVIADGVRCHEIFDGIDSRLLNKEFGGVESPETLRETFWRETPQARREVLFPFVWSAMATQGQLFGDTAKNSVCRVTNGHNFSYPCYSEILCGFVDARMDSNAKIPNPNRSVLEWLHEKPAFKNRVAAFAAWDVFASILNRDRCGFPVVSGYDTIESGDITSSIVLLNRLKAELPRKWDWEPFDAMTFHSAREYLLANRPRILLIVLGETDEWPHEGRYDAYIRACHQADASVRDIWHTAQSLEMYRDKTALLFLTDHGRGDGLETWKGHGSDIPESADTWLAAMGTGIASLGSRTNHPPIAQTQIAATVAALLGETYHDAVPHAGGIVPELFHPNA